MSNLENLYEKFGQSPWIDNIRRDWLDDGTLAQLVADGVRGVTSNPAIFAKAFATSSAYDASLVGLASHDPETLFERLAVRDVQDACDVLRGVFEDSSRDFQAGRRRHLDGFVSLEVSPRLAHDTDATIDAAKRLWRDVSRPNLMIKIPATVEGLPAITAVLAEGINVNVTLIFSIERYAAVLDAWAAGLREAQSRNQDLSRIASVASFFVSRVDAAVDPLLDEGDPRRGTTANAQVAAAYQHYLSRTAAPDVESLLASGAQVQRPLWASTSVKNPSYDELLYVDFIVAGETVNTMPDATLHAAAAHGRFDRSTLLDPQSAAREAARLSNLPPSVDLAAITTKLEQDGVAAFVASYEELLETVASKMRG